MPHCPCHSICAQPQLNTAGSREQCISAVEAAVDAGHLHETQAPESAGPFPPGIVHAYACTTCRQTWVLELPDRASGSWRSHRKAQPYSDAALSR